MLTPRSRSWLARALSAVVAVSLASGLTLSACSSGASSTDSTQPAVPTAPASSASAEPSPEPTAEATSAVPSSGSGAGLAACQVTDVGGLNDNGRNASTWKGVMEAATQLGVEANLLEVTSAADYGQTIQTFVDQDCSVIVTVGSTLGGPAGDATREAANASPDVPFSIVNHEYTEGEIANNNVLSQVFSVEQAAYLAGYLAAGTTKTGKVGTFGGTNVPEVTAYMDGFYNGVQRYNADNAASVAVLGWDPSQPTQGLFTGSFDSVADARVMAKGLVDQGADIVLPVAGSASVGAANLASKLGPGSLMVIGTESDQFEADAANKGVYLTSVLSNADVTTFKAIATVVDGSFQGGVIDGTLANGGVGLAPYHDLAAVVAQQLQDQLTTVTAGIVDGSIDVLASA